jgi:hypothetical protein
VSQHPLSELDESEKQMFITVTVSINETDCYMLSPEHQYNKMNITILLLTLLTDIVGYKTEPLFIFCTLWKLLCVKKKYNFSTMSCDLHFSGN